MHHFGCGMNWINGLLHDCEGKIWNLLIFNLFNGNGFLNIVILYYLLMRRDVWFENHLVFNKIGEFASSYRYFWPCFCSFLCLQLDVHFPYVVKDVYRLFPPVPRSHLNNQQLYVLPCVKEMGLLSVEMVSLSTRMALSMLVISQPTMASDFTSNYKDFLCSDFISEILHPNAQIWAFV